MCFDVLKVVWSPGYDHGHDEESRNGRDIKIDILDDYIRTPDEFRGSPDIYWSAERVIGTTEEVMGLIGPRGERERGAARGWPHAPHGPSPNWTRREGRRPPLSLSSPPILLGLGKGGGTQFGLGLGGALHLAASSSLPLRPNKAHTLPGGFR